jgi:hypothetical protein
MRSRVCSVEEVKKTSAARKKLSLLILQYILTFRIFIVSGYVLSLPLSYSLRADKLANPVIKQLQDLTQTKANSKNLAITYFYKSLSTYKSIITFIMMDNEVLVCFDI